MKKRILSVILTIAMILSIIPASVLAAGTQRTTQLNLTTQETADMLDSEGWKWNADTKTLILDGIDISVASGYAIITPAGTTIILAAGSTNKVETTAGGTAFGIYVNGDLTIYSEDSENQGTLNIQSTNRGLGTQPTLSADQNFNISISDIVLNIDAKVGINTIYTQSAYRADMSLSMSGVDYNYTASATYCAYQIITHNGNSSVSLTNGTTSDGGTMTNWASGNSGKTTLTVTDSTLTTDSRRNDSRNNSIELGNGAANDVELNIKNSKIVAVSQIGGGFAVRPNGNGTYSMNISDSTFLIAATNAFPGKSDIPEGNTVTAVSHYGNIGTGTDADGNKTMTLPVGTTITSNGTTYTIDGSASTVSFDAKKAAMLIPAGTVLKTADGTTVTSEGVLTVASGADPAMTAGTKTTVTTNQNISVGLTSEKDDVTFHIDSRGNIEISENTTVTVDEGASVDMPNGGVVTNTGEIIKTGIVSISSASTDTTVNNTVNVSVNVNGDDTFNAAEIELQYSNDLLEFDEAASNLSGATVKATDGKLMLVDYGEDETCRDGVYTLVFKAIKGGDANVSLTSAKTGTAASAETMNLLNGYCKEGDVAVVVKNNVTLDNIFKGDASVVNGEKYTFTVEEATGSYYDYELPTATIGGAEATVIDNGDGTWTVENVTGELVITGTRTPKTHNVTISGDNAANDGTTATYLTNYTFTLADDLEASTLSGYVYAVESVKIGGVAYTSYTVNERVYTIAGADITGDIEIVISKTITDPDQFNVTKTGDGAGAATISEVVVDINGNAVLTLTPEAGYIYTVTADGYEVEQDGNVYTVKNVTKTVEFIVDREIDVAGTTGVNGVIATEYVQLNGTKMWLVTIGNKIDDKVYTYNGQNMFWSDKYETYATLVVSTTQPVIEAANFDIVTANANTVSYIGDVNITGTVDANDAQLVWNMYEAKYSTFTSTVTVEKFLRADVNGDKKIDVNDATAIVNDILK